MAMGRGKRGGVSSKKSLTGNHGINTSGALAVILKLFPVSLSLCVESFTDDRRACALEGKSGPADRGFQVAANKAGMAAAAPPPPLQQNSPPKRGLCH